jgi:hypothetical protein
LSVYRPLLSALPFPLGGVPSRGVLVPLGELPLPLTLLPPVIVVWTDIFEPSIPIIPLLLYAVHVTGPLLHGTRIHTHVAHLTGHHLHAIPNGGGISGIRIVVSRDRHSTGPVRHVALVGDDLRILRHVAIDGVVLTHWLTHVGLLLLLLGILLLLLPLIAVVVVTVVPFIHAIHVVHGILPASSNSQLAPINVPVVSPAILPLALLESPRVSAPDIALLAALVVVGSAS